MGDTSQHTCQNQETSQELRMLSSVTIKCQVTKIVMNSGYEFRLSIVRIVVGVSNVSKDSRLGFVGVFVLVFVKNCQN